MMLSIIMLIAFVFMIEVVIIKHHVMVTMVNITVTFM